MRPNLQTAKALHVVENCASEKNFKRKKKKFFSTREKQPLTPNKHWSTSTLQMTKICWPPFEVAKVHKLI